MPHHAVFSDFAPVTSTTSGLHIYDFVGSATRVAYKRGWAKHAIVPGRPVTPAYPVVNEHYADWIAVLRSVQRATGVFRMAELGAGWAPWLVRAAQATRQRLAITGLELVAVEADQMHHHWAQTHFTDNGLDPAAHHILRAAVSGQAGTLRFPVVPEPDVDYGASLASVSGDLPYVDVPALTIADVLDRFSGPLDLMHVDIQGAEYDALPPALPLLHARVKSIMVGTHQSDAKHDTLVGQFLAAGWRPVMTYPRSRTSSTPYGEIAFDDGFLLFDNPDFHRA